MNKIKNNFNPLTKKSISKQFFLNYIILFVILLIIWLVINKIGYMYMNYTYDISDTKIENTYNNIYEYGIEKAYNMENYQKETYLEILDDDLNVLDSYNSPHEIGYMYNQEDFNRMTTEYYGQFAFYYPGEYDEFLMIYFPADNIEKSFDKVSKFQIIFFVLSLMIVLLIYVQITSKQIVKPINKLLKGVATIGDGNYTTEISFECNNELDYLKDAINNMAKKIEEEISLREKAEQNRKQLLLDISHDLKTPLTNILGYSETLLEEAQLTDAEKSVYLNIIASNSKRANVLIQDLFQLSQMEHEEYSLPTNPQDICEFIREILIGYIPLLREKNMDYYFDIPEDSIMCSINPDKLDRSISNLITNSVKYSGENTKLTIEISTVDTMANIIIKDNGTGIDKKFAETIFDPFIRTDTARNSKTGGTGLGLAITKKIIEKHGGTIKLDTSIKEGCKFIITLPIIS